MNSLKTLIVDDHLAMRSTLQAIFQDYGYSVNIAASGEEAVAFCKKEDYDVILMEERLPGMTGIEALKKIKNLSTGSRVILMSSCFAWEQSKLAIEQGALSFLQKPLDIPVLFKLIEEGSAQPA